LIILFIFQAATSKFLNLADLNTTSENFGFRGEALASISEVSLLEIVTRAYGKPNGYKKVLKVGIISNVLF
jgi:DNA mismatch repair protein MLH3